MSRLWLQIPEGKGFSQVKRAVQDLSADLERVSGAVASLAKTVSVSTATTTTTGATGGDLSYTFVQTTAADTWTVDHNLGKNPSVVIVDSGGTTLWADVLYVSPNSLVITFSQPISGKAYCN